MEKTFISKRNKIDKASGIDVPEESEAGKGLADIIEQFKDCEAKATEEKEHKKDAVVREVTQAEEFRKQSLETIGETKKRTMEDEGTSKRNGKRRRTSDGTIEYLREKSKSEQEIRIQEMEIKKSELTDRREETKVFREMLLQQQHKNSTLIQQQQQLNMILLQLLTGQKKQ